MRERQYLLYQLLAITFLFFVSNHNANAQLINWLSAPQTIKGDSVLSFSKLINIPYYPIKQGNYYLLDFDPGVTAMKDDSIVIGPKQIAHYPYWVFKNEFVDLCDIPHEPSWLSDSIVVGYDIIDGLVVMDSVIFVNENNEKIIIRSQGVLGEEWTTYDNGNGLTILGQVSLQNTMNWNVFEDSVKQITFQAFVNGEEVNHEINDAKLFLSKEHGIINYFPLREFPNISSPETYLSIGSDIDEKGVRNLSSFKIWDYAVGDEFHKMKSITYILDDDCCTHDSTLTIEKIIGRRFEDDHLTYKRSTDTYYSRYLRDSFIESTITSNLIDSFDIYADPQWEGVSGERVFESVDATTGAYQNVHPGDGLLGGLSYKYWSGNYYYLEEGCWWQLIVDGLCDYALFYEGIGIIPADCYNPWEGTETNAELVYFRKGTTEKGAPLEFTTNIKKINRQNDVQIFPVPTNDILTIKVSADQFIDGSIEIRNLQGQLLFAEKVNGHQAKLDVSTIQPGMYFALIPLKDKSIVTKYFLKH